MMRRAFQATEALGSLTVVLAIMDNSTRHLDAKLLGEVCLGTSEGSSKAPRTHLKHPQTPS